MRIDPVSLQLFVAVMETGSIAAASQREHLAAAAVSRRVADLETQLGTPLLLRHARGVEPTAAGLALRDLARQALHLLDDLPAQLRDYASGVRGQVRVFANISSITQFLPADLARFAQAHPQVRIQLEESNSPATVRAVAENAADVGVYTAYAHDDSVQSLPYRQDRLCLVVPRHHPLLRRKRVQFADVLDEPFVGLRTGSAINLLLATQAARLGRSLKLSIQVTGFDAICLMVERGFGVGVVPEGVFRLYAAALDIGTVTLKDTWAQRELRLAVRNLEQLPAAARRLVDQLQASGQDDRG
jgi:DNA-binding transcriptional LysR family regulator